MEFKCISSSGFEEVHKRLQQYNASAWIKGTQPFEEINRCAFDNQEIIGGILGDIELGSALHIRLFFIDTKYRCCGVGSKLLKEIEDEAKNKGASFSYVETFDFQAKGFYEKNSYEVFSMLEYTSGNVLYFMKKELE